MKPKTVKNRFNLVCRDNRIGLTLVYDSVADAGQMLMITDS